LNSYERVMNRLAGRKVDRLPNMCLTMMFAARQAGVPFGQFVSDYRLLVEGTLRCHEKFGFDMVCAVSDPMREAEGLGTEVLIPEDGVPHAKEKRIKTLADIQTLRVIDPSSGKRMNDRIEAIRLLKAKVGNDVPIVGWIEGAIAESCDLMGVQDFMINLMDEPESMEELMEICMTQCLAFAKAQVEAGADIIGLGDAASSLLGPALYEEYALPYQQKMISAIHEMGAKVKLHICGNLNAVMEHVAKTGTDIVDLDSMVDINRAAEILPESCSICGNLDPVSVLFRGNPKLIAKEVNRCMEIKDSNRNIIAAGCEIPRDTPEENVLAIQEAIINYRR